MKAASKQTPAIAARPLGRVRELKYCPVGEVYTVGHALRDYLEAKRLYSSEAHVDVMVYQINLHILDALGTMPLDDVGGTELRAFIREALETPSSKTAGAQRLDIDQLDDERLRLQRRKANSLITILKQAFTMAWEDGKTDNQRCWRMLRRIRNVDRPRCVHLSRDECRALTSNAHGPLRALVLAALYTGCRIGELLAMQVCDVGRDGYGVYVKPGKRKRARFVCLSDEGMAFFLGCIEGRPADGMLFERAPGVPWCRWAYSRQLKSAAVDAGLPPEITWHALRHTYASQLIQSGVSPVVVAEQLGHSNPITVLKTYAHLGPQVRESEVRQRFTSVSEEYAELAEANKSEMTRWRSEQYGGSWETYAKIN